jgi:hypothetical protein
VWFYALLTINGHRLVICKHTVMLVVVGPEKMWSNSKLSFQEN